MAAQREYELVLMLDASRDAPARDSLAEEAKGMIEGGGTLKHENNWGLRKLAFEIGQQTEADYRWFRFEAPTELLEQLDHNLKIADGVLRFRVFKVDPEAPVLVPPAVAAPVAGRDRERPSSDRERPGPDRERPAPAAPPAAAPAPPPPAAPAPAEEEPAAPAEPAVEEEPAPAAEPVAAESGDESSD